MAESTLQVHEVEFELSENFLEKNPTIKDMYNDGVLKIALSNQIDKDFSKAIIDVIPDMNSKDILTFNPLLEAINTIADYKSVISIAKPKRDEEMDDKQYADLVKKWIKDEEETYKSITSPLRTFNGSITKTKKIIKDPVLEQGRKIDKLFNALKDFSDSVKTIADKNFDELIKEKEKIQAEKDAAAKAIEDAAIKDLELKNQEANDKLMQSEKKNQYADLITDVMKYFEAEQLKVKTLNLAGLNTLKTEFEEKTFEMEGLSDEDVEKANGIINMFRTGAVATVDSAIKRISEVPEATITSSAPVPPKVELPKANQSISDAIFRLSNVKAELEKINIVITEKSDKYEKVKTTLATEFPEILAKVNRLIPYLEKVQKSLIKNS